MGDGVVHEIHGKGDVQISPGNKNCIKDVLCVPLLKSNLLCLVQLLQQGYSFVFEDMSCVVVLVQVKGIYC